MPVRGELDLFFQVQVQVIIGPNLGVGPGPDLDQTWTGPIFLIDICTSSNFCSKYYKCNIFYIVCFQKSGVLN